jgi:hypothetical protein
MKTLDREVSLSKARSLLDELLAMVTKVASLPPNSDVYETSIAQGRDLMEGFSKIPCPRARALIIELVRTVGTLAPKRGN